MNLFVNGFLFGFLTTGVSIVVFISGYMTVDCIATTFLKSKKKEWYEL